MQSHINHQNLNDVMVNLLPTRAYLRHQTTYLTYAIRWENLKSSFYQFLQEKMLQQKKQIILATSAFGLIVSMGPIQFTLVASSFHIP
jgi:uncharacterized protein YfeS